MADKKLLEQEVVAVKKDIDDVDMAIQKIEQEKTNRDHTIRSLNDEIANQDEVLNKLNKEKKHASENSAKSSEDLQVAEEKVGHLNKIKSKLESTLEELEEELEAERQARAKAERQRSDLAREIEGLGERLEEASGATSAQIELNKKREAEVGKLRKDLEEAHIQQESTLVGLKKKHQDAIAEMSEQIEQLNKMKSKIEKDKTHIMHEIADVRAATDEVIRSKASGEKSHKNLLDSLNAIGKKVEEANLTLGDFDAAKRKLTGENADVLRQLQELENSANMLVKVKSGLVALLDEARAVADNEAKERQSLLGKFRNAEHEVGGMKEHLDEEVAAKENLLRQLNKATGEADMWCSRFEKEGVAKAEELEMAKLKMQARLSEAESTITQLHAKLSQLDKAKGKLQGELDDMNVNLDQAQILNASMEKKAKQFDRIVGEWKGKVDGIGMDLDNSQKETRIASAQLFQVKSAYEEGVLQLDEVRRENKTLSNEIKDIMDQIGEGGRSIHEIG